MSKRKQKPVRARKNPEIRGTKQRRKDNRGPLQERNDRIAAIKPERAPPAWRQKLADGARPAGRAARRQCRSKAGGGADVHKEEVSRCSEAGWTSTARC